MIKRHNITKTEYINELPENVFEIRNYDNYYNSQFNRYWWDPINNKLIMKPKRGNKYKIVHPMTDKHHENKFVHLYDIDDNQIFVNYDALMYSYSPAYYLNHLI